MGRIADIPPSQRADLNKRLLLYSDGSCSVRRLRSLPRAARIVTGRREERVVFGEDKRKLELKPANLYQAAVYAWNAFREDKTLNSVKYDTKKGLHHVSA